jgi:hypothetical protein
LKKRQLEEIIQDKTFFQEARLIVATLFPAIKVLRLSDSNTPGMDKLFYFCRQTAVLLTKTSVRFNKPELFVHDEIPTINVDIDDIDNYDSDTESIVLDDDPDDSHTDHFNSKTLGNQILHLWEKREDKLMHDFAVVGWLLCVEPTIYQDAANHTQEHYQVFLQTSRKLLQRPGFSDETIDSLVTDCAEQFALFRSKQGQYCGLPAIWKSKMCTNGQSHLWHQAHTRPLYKELGSVACRVTSKLLGIGSAERAWGDVKHLKEGKRSHLCHRTTERSSIIFGTACLDAARIKAMETGPHFWGPQDLNDTELNRELEQFDTDCLGDNSDDEIDESFCETTLPVAPRDALFLTKLSHKIDRVFCTYHEDWEKKEIFINDDKSMFRLLNKYGNIRYINPDSCNAYTVVANIMSFQNVPSHKRKQWCLYGALKGTIPTDDNVEDLDVVAINNDFFLQVKICQQDNIKLVDQFRNAVDREKMIRKNFSQLEVTLLQDWECF